MLIRPASTADAEAIAAVYAAGVSEGTATFQPVPLQASVFERRIVAGELFLVAVQGEELLGAGWVADYDPVNAYYAGVGEVTVYVAPRHRRAGAGRALLEALAKSSGERGRHKLVGKIFATNAPSLGLFDACGYRRVGIHHRHSELGGEWKDVVVVERSLADA